MKLSKAKAAPKCVTDQYQASAGRRNGISNDPNRPNGEQYRPTPAREHNPINHGRYRITGPSYEASF
jgi:hypothetical protein